MESNKAKIIEDGNVFRYFDKEGNELHDGDFVRFDGEVTVDGNPLEKVLYMTEDGELGTDATNPAWIERGYPPCYFGIYAITDAKVLEHTELIKKGEMK